MISVSRLVLIKNIFQKIGAFQNSLFAMLNPSVKVRKFKNILCAFKDDLIREGLTLKEVDELLYIKQMVKKVPSLFEAIKEMIYDFEHGKITEGAPDEKLVKSISKNPLLFSYKTVTAEEVYHLIFVDEYKEKLDIHIIKTSAKSQDAIFISELFRILGIERMGMTPLADNRLDIEFVKGMSVIDMPKINDLERAKILAFLLGRSLIDASIVGLSDRGAVNLRINMDMFNEHHRYRERKLRKCPNPITNIDYEMKNYSLFNDIRNNALFNHIRSNGFGTYGIFWKVLGQIVDDSLFEANLLELGKIFSDAACFEYEKIIDEYHEHREEVRVLLRNFGKGDILDNFQHSSDEIREIIASYFHQAVTDYSKLRQRLQPSYAT